MKEGKHKQREGENTVLFSESQAGRWGQRRLLAQRDKSRACRSLVLCSEGAACWRSSALPAYTQLIILLRIDTEFRMLWLLSSAVVERMVYHSMMP